MTNTCPTRQLSMVDIVYIFMMATGSCNNSTVTSIIFAIHDDPIHERCKDPSLQMDEEDRQVDPTHASTENIPK
jgi:hypothetical protein